VPFLTRDKRQRHAAAHRKTKLAQLSALALKRTQQALYQACRPTLRRPKRRNFQRPALRLGSICVQQQAAEKCNADAARQGGYLQSPGGLIILPPRGPMCEFDPLDHVYLTGEAANRQPRCVLRYML
jgi:hypothetical protein